MPVLNRWISGLFKKADCLAALDKVIQPSYVSPESAAYVREKGLLSKSAAREGGITGHASCFASISGEQLRAAKPASATMEEWAEMLRFAYAQTDGISTKLGTCWLYAGIFADGPKIYCPTLEEWEALARVELRVPISLYRQPFDTTIIVIPDGAFGSVSADVGVPGFCAVRHWNHGDDNGLISGLVVGTNSTYYELDFRISWLDGGSEELEARLRQINEASKQFTDIGDSYSLQGGESEALEKIKRAVLNACLLLSQHAPRLIGKQNPAVAEKLKAKLAKRKIPAHINAQNARQLHLMPTVYGFHQHIKVCEHVREEDDSNPTGTQPPKTPHWRRGHWLHQAYGEGRKERKLQFRPAKLVNEHLLNGPRANTRVTMTTG